MKRMFDILVSSVGLIIVSPLLIPVCILIWLQDYHSPFYVAPRVGRFGKTFKMIKLRSMIINADKSGIDSTAANDKRITKLGQFVRRYKLDELPQLINVLKGDMSLVGPRPNVKRDTDLYTDVEKGLLLAQPGITDMASIVFADEGEILKGSEDPDLKYNQVIRPWKSRLALLGIEKSSLGFDMKLIMLTAKAIVSRKDALAGVNKLLRDVGASDDLQTIALREQPLLPTPPPGADSIVTSRNH